MDKNNTRIINEWINWSKAIKKMYKKMADLEIEGNKYSDEYNLILDLLEDVLEKEDEIIKGLNITIYNYDELIEYVASTLDNVDVTNPETNIENLRVYNRLLQIVVDSNFSKNGVGVNDYYEYMMWKKETDYEINYLNAILGNFATTVSKNIHSNKKSEYIPNKKKFIYQKEFIIFTLPKYEYNYAFFKKELPILEFNDEHCLCSYNSASEFYNTSIVSIINQIYSQINSLISIDNKKFGSDIYKEHAYVLYFSIKSKLLSFPNLEFMYNLLEDVESQTISVENRDFTILLTKLAIGETIEELSNRNNLKKKKKTS